MNDSPKTKAGRKKTPDLITRTAREMEAHHKAFEDVPRVNLDDAKRILSRILALVFPHYVAEKSRRPAGVKKAVRELHDDLTMVLGAAAGWQESTARQKAAAFLEALPELAENVRLDAEALYNSDPASKSLAEVILAYPGCYAVSAYRFAHYFLRQEVPLLPRLMAEYAHRVTGIDINPGATIGKALYIDHGTGVVIGETAVIGNNVQIYQGVTLGALKVQKRDRAKKRHPTVEDNVVIYAGATILGGDTVIGHDSIIGGNVWITSSILPHSRVMYKSSDEAESGLNWTI